MVSRETRTTPKTGRMPYRQEARDLNTILDNLSWEQAGDYGKRALQSGWESLKGGAGTLQDALNTPIEDVDWYDAARGLGTGLRQGTEGLLSLPGAAQDMTDILRDTLAMRMGLSPERAAQLQRYMDMASPLAPLARNLDVEDLSQRYIGDYYEPKTPLGKTMEFGGQMVDPSIAVPGGAAYKLARRMF